MDDSSNKQSAVDSEDNPLESTPTTPVVTDDGAAPANLSDSLDGAVDPQPTDPSSSVSPTQPSKSLRHRLLGRLNGLNVYILVFMLILLVAAAILIISYLDSKHAATSGNITSQNLSANALQQLASTSPSIGSPNQVLNVQSSAVFAGNVLLHQDLDVAGNLQLGGTLALNSLAVSGSAQFAQAQINNNLSVGGNLGLQGALTVAKSLQVNGSGSFSGALNATQLTVSTLQLNGDLVLDHHLITGGPAPGRANGNALGSGGTTSVSGSDTSGSITINTGGNPTLGCFVTINFTSAYSSTPHVLITPIGVSAGGLSYYVNRSSSSFSVCDATSPPANTSFGFDYFVVD